MRKIPATKVMMVRMIANKNASGRYLFTSDTHALVIFSTFFSSLLVEMMGHIDQIGQQEFCFRLTLNFFNRKFRIDFCQEESVFVTSMTHISVMIISTWLFAVSGSAHFSRILGGFLSLYAPWPR